MVETFSAFYIIVSLTILVLTIIMIVKFFQIASDVRALRNKYAPDQSQAREAVTQVDGQPSNPQWECPKCHHMNPGHRTACFKCLEEKPV